MPLSAGDRLGPYEIAASIGAGGMGEVYRARDTRIGRDVAVKVSAERFSDRFEREARAIASLNHPNVCTLHDVGPNYLVMELVEGPTLAERIEEGKIPLDEALAIARQIAGALEAAHELGVVHRDLKPGNIKIKPDGAVKVLDFGLAKLGGTSATQSENSPTFTLGPTVAGVILGTAGYMSPEQARGKPVDKRADIWAFGVVLYEMATGKRLFAGSDLTETLAAVIKDEPSLDAVPANIRPMLRRCLEKDPRKRLRDIGDALPMLDTPPPLPPPPERPMPWWWPTLAGVALVAAAILAFVHFREKPEVAAVTRFQIPLPGGSNGIELSPDGRRLAFTAAGSDGHPALWVREMDSLEPHMVPGTDSVASPFFWSSDSRFLVLHKDGKLKKADVLGGPVQVICDTPAEIGGSWSRQGTILFAGPYGLLRVPESGGTPAPVEAIPLALFPLLLADGKHFLYFRVGIAEENGVYAGSLDAAPGKLGKRLVATSFKAQFVPSRDPALGYILFLQERNLFAQTLNLSSMEPVGGAIPIAERIGTFAAGGLFAASENVLVYRHGTGMVDRLTWFDRQGKDVGHVGETGLYADVAIAPDGARVATSLFGDSALGIGLNLWVYDLVRDVRTRLSVLTAGLNISPVWAPDGSRVVFTRDKLYQRSSNGTGPETLLLDRNVVATSWSPGGKFLLYTQADPKTGDDVWAMPDPGSTPAGKPIPVLNTGSNERMAQFSPDGRWIAYVSDESGHPEVYVQPFPPSSAEGLRKTISQGGGDQPRWRRDGKELLFIGPNQTLMSVEISRSGTSLQAGIPRSLFRVPVRTTEIGGQLVVHWDASADGTKFLVDTVVEGPPEPAIVVTNWQALLKK